jgi:hypothetical protein
MIFVFDKETKHFVGMATRVFDNGTMREATVEELYPNTDRSKLGFVYVEDSPKYSMNPEGWQLKFDQNGEAIGIERKPNLPKVFLATNAIDTDGDGMPELPADGQSKAVIRAQVKDSQGQLIQGDLLLDFRTTGGTLSARKVPTQTGQATVELTASLETVQVTVTVSAEGVTENSVTFEFMPPPK